MFSVTKLAALLDMFGGERVPYANRNGFIDGRFDHWVLNSAAITPGTPYSAPSMWVGTAGAGGAGTLERLTLGDDGQDDTDSNALNAARFTQTTASTAPAGGSLPAFFQRIEGANSYSGKSVTISFKLRAVSGNMHVANIYMQQMFGTTGSPSAFVEQRKDVNWTLTDRFKRYSVRVDLPSTQGKTFTTNHCLLAALMFNGQVGAIDIAEAQIEQCSRFASADITGNGGAPTTFEWRGFPTEAARVHRYHQPFAIRGDGYQTAGATASANTMFLAQMRGVPAVQATDGNAGAVSPTNSFQPTNVYIAVLNQMTATGSFLIFSSGFLDARL